ncbi:chaperone DnaJ domain protein [Rhodococcus sp. MTM3W5.2]|uniref:hypothetical protein n=1 Tax=Rhodococcus sp. MTM3W5.2 TaxID=1805827 RepID=UPI0009793E33|nr:chaperone DnaJ domain protein [Rhodococcus sp. MTM3W5.2]
MVPARLDGKQTAALNAFKDLRDKDHAEVVTTASQHNGGLFSRLRDAFSGR